MSKIQDSPIVLENGVILLSQKEMDDRGFKSPKKSQYQDSSYTNTRPFIIRIEDHELIKSKYYTSVKHNIKNKSDCIRLGKIYAMAPKNYCWCMEWYPFSTMTGNRNEEWYLKHI